MNKITKGDFLKYVRDPEERDWGWVGKVPITLEKRKVYKVYRYATDCTNSYGEYPDSVQFILDDDSTTYWYPITMFKKVIKNINNT